MSGSSIRAAAGQLAVFGSEPGEKDYNPLWEERFVTFKPGVTPVLLTSDNQINSLAKAGKLTNQDAHIVLTHETIRELARARLGFERLRPGQLRAVAAAAGGRDVLAVLPTGGGKSAIYELAGMLREGPTVVVSPLIALQADQLAHLRAAGLPAIVLNSQQSGSSSTRRT